MIRSYHLLPSQSILCFHVSRKTLLRKFSSSSASAAGASASSSDRVSYTESEKHSSQNEDEQGAHGESSGDPPLPNILPAYSRDGPVLAQDNLFHILSRSPFQDLRDKAARIKGRAYCPVNLRDGKLKLVDFECPYCGFPTHASRTEWEEDDQHDRYWPRLREVNEDEHDVRSGRRFWELEMPPIMDSDTMVAMSSSWELFCYSAGFQDMTERQLRHLTKQLTFPMTIASTIAPGEGQFHLSNDRLTPEGKRSMLALQETAFRTRGTAMSLAQKPYAPLRIIIIGARIESAIDGTFWHMLVRLFRAKHFPPSFHLYFIGPEVMFPASMVPSEEKYGVQAATRSYDRHLQLTAIKCRYEEIHEALAPFDPYYDIFFAFQPGFGFPDLRDHAKVQLETNWRQALGQILQTDCALICSGLSPADVERDVLALDRVSGVAGTFDWVLTPGENVFKSRRWEIAEFDPRIIAQANALTWGIRRKAEVDLANLLSGGSDVPQLESEASPRGA